MEKLDCNFEIKDITATGTFAGYGNVYGIVDDGNDIVAHGAFGASLADWGAKGRLPEIGRAHV